MSGHPLLNSPLLLGFDALEAQLDRVLRAPSDGYPPYNIERLDERSLRITLAVAGFAETDLDVTVEGQELVVRGKQARPSQDREFLHRGIAARQFQRSFMLADGLTVVGAQLALGLLHIDVKKPETQAERRTISISRP